MTDSQDTALPPFDPQQAVFTALAYWVAERDGITPAEAAVNLGHLFASPAVIEQTAADQQAAAAEQAAPVQEAVDKINAALAELRTQLGL